MMPVTEIWVHNVCRHCRPWQKEGLREQSEEKPVGGRSASGPGAIVAASGSAILPAILAPSVFPIPGGPPVTLSPVIPCVSSRRLHQARSLADPASLLIRHHSAPTCFEDDMMRIGQRQGPSSGSVESTNEGKSAARADRRMSG